MYAIYPRDVGVLLYTFLKRSHHSNILHTYDYFREIFSSLVIIVKIYKYRPIKR